MKKFRSILLIILAFSMIFSLASCMEVDDPEETTETPESEKTYTADELYEKIDAKMNDYDSYEAAIEMVMNVTVNGVYVKSTGKGTAIECGVNSENYEFYTELSVTISSPALPSTQKVTTIEAYHGGNYFMSNRGQGAEQKFYSPMTLEEAEKMRDDDDTALMDYLSLENCVNKEVKANEDGSYELICSGYTANSVHEIMEKTGMDTSMITSDVVDVVVTIKADNEFNATEIGIEFVFEQKPGEKETPVFTFKGTYSKYNEAEINTSSINPEKYVKVDDLGMLAETKELLDAKLAKEEGSFTLDISQTLKIMGETQQNAETDNVTFGKNDKGYFYDIDADMNGTKYDISYSQGVQTVTANGQTQQGAQTEAEARAFVESLMNSCQFNENLVKDMKKESDTKYVFTCEPKDTYKALIEQMGATFRSVSQTITITVENGEIVKIESEVKAKGAVTQGNSTFELSFTVISNVKFDK